MKKKFFLTCLSFLIIFSLPTGPPASGQEKTPEFNFKKAYEDYLYNYNLYHEAHKDYLVAKNQYETYKTLTAKTIALERTTSMLQARDEAIATFLAALRIKLADETNVSSSKLNLLYIRLDEEAIWFRNHKENLTSAGSIPDLIKISNRAQSRYGGAEALIYQSLLEISFHKEALLHEKLQEKIDEAETKIAHIRAKGDKNIAAIERWLLEAKNRKARSDEKLQAARPLTITNKQSSKDKLQQFNKITYLLEQSHQYLKEVNRNLIEIIKELKRGD
jgi:hypothetical protein